MDRHSRCIVSYCCSVSVSDVDQERTGFGVSSGCFSIKYQHICRLHTSGSSVVCPPEYGIASIGRDISSFFSKYLALRFSLLSGENVFECLFFNSWFSGNTICTKLDTRRVMMHKPKQDISLV